MQCDISACILTLIEILQAMLNYVWYATKNKLDKQIAKSNYSIHKR